MLEKLTEDLAERLKENLPGQEAQERMAPIIGRDVRFDERLRSSARPAGALILLFQDDDSIAFPLIRRPVYRGAHSGQISLPGGKKDPRDRDLVDTALREAREEIGVMPGDVRVIGSLTPLYVRVSGFTILPVVGAATKAPEFKPDDYEVDELVIAHLSELSDAENLKMGVVRASPGYTLKAPYFSIKGHVVWGATAMILSEFLHIIRKSL